ncbi:metal-dependent transcriptional regulator [soil metagenome]|jgi:DtxR family Mn-dependent transcriptional regulator
MTNFVAAGAPSSSVGDYLKAVWEVAGASGEAAGTSEVAARLSVSAASVSNMFVRLQEMGLVEYERYRGALLTDRGRREALRLVRRHRLIEAFLLEHLSYSWEEVHEEAERLEHAVSDEFTERLASFLGHPGHDPHGDPIPTATGALEPDDSFPLSEAEAGQRVKVFKVRDEDAAVLDYFGERGLVPGKVLTVKETRKLDAVVTVEDENGESFSFGQPLASSIFVHVEP